MKVNCHVLGLHSQYVYVLHLLLFPVLHPINKLSAKRIPLHNIPDRETDYLRVLHHPKVLEGELTQSRYAQLCQTL